jgi:hypothetical protein
MLATLAPVLSGVGVAPATNSYFSIATQTVGAIPATTITFSSIPSTYTHLQVRGIGRSSGAATAAVVSIVLNSDTGANYAFHDIEADGSSVGAYGTSSQTNIYGCLISANTAGSNVFGAQVIDILDYANTNKYKTARIMGAYDNNGTGGIRFGSGLWQSTSAVSSITLSLGGATTFLQYSSFALYGVK